MSTPSRLLPGAASNTDHRSTVPAAGGPRGGDIDSAHRPHLRWRPCDARLALVPSGILGVWSLLAVVGSVAFFWMFVP